MIDIHVHPADARCISPGFIAGVAGSMFDGGQSGGGNVERAVRLHLSDRNARRLLSQTDTHAIVESILLIADFGPALGEGASLPTLGREQRYPQSLEEVMRRFPDVPIAPAHGMVWDLEGTIELLERHPRNLYSDISSFQLLSDHGLEMVLEGCAKAPDQVIFGSDAPLYDLSGNPGAKLEEMRSRLTPGEQAGLFELNARTFLYGASAR
ncbi:amidohydrolase family protein [Streptosporangium carneum]|uniref:Amidohydrolase-related domain-containing protein n=1 Tax=Streptosporangium carneum TaxID=47481 RepID=A0A9W6HVF8_9ACTN|nr:amidohydrolase family protein [Streptosporangium carneum]GLK06757.1 hypothetical protein GCM10017600_01620 [Streptosporangium carneum]